MCNYAYMLNHGLGLQTDKEEAARYYKMAADEGNANAMFIYACMLENGDGIAPNEAEASIYYKKAADNGNEEAIQKMNNGECNIF